MADNKDFSERLNEVRQRKQFKNNDALDNAKIMPQAKDLEMAVLGALMLEAGAIDKIIDIVQSDTFYFDAHQRVFNAMKLLYQENEPVDILTVTEKLKSLGDLDTVGGPFFIASLTNKVASSANIEFHARIVAEKYLKRELITVSAEITKDAFDETVDVFNVLDKAEADLFKLTESNIKKGAEKIGNVLLEELDEIDQRRQKAIDGDVLTGVGSGFTNLDRLTAGWQKSDLIILAARPGMGKTAFTLALARNAAVDLEKPVAFFSLEMSSNQLVSRLISMETEISGEKLRKGTLLEREWKHLTKNIDNLQKAPLFIDDTPAIGIFELRAKCRRLKAKHDIQMIVIDYLQLMTGSTDGKSNGNREQEISMISRNLKGIAKEMNVPVIALSQLSRAVETRGGAKRPMLSDLRESGAIEQDADMVIFLYRPEYYKITQDEDGMDCRGVGEVIVAKHRNGALETVKVRFVPHLAKFENLENNHFTEPAGHMDDNTITRSSSMNAPGESMGDSAGFEEEDVPF